MAHTFILQIYMHVFPDIIKVDVFIQTHDTLMELCRALKMSRMEESTFKVEVNKLDLTCLGAPRIAILLELVNTKVKINSQLFHCSVFHILL